MITHLSRLAATVALFAPLVAFAQQPTPGTYRVWLCAQACAPEDSARAVAAAILVIVDDSAAASEPARAVLSALSNRRVSRQLAGNVRLEVVRNAGHTLEETGALGRIGELAVQWLDQPSREHRTLRFVRRIQQRFLLSNR